MSLLAYISIFNSPSCPSLLLDEDEDVVFSDEVVLSDDEEMLLDLLPRVKREQPPKSNMDRHNKQAILFFITLLLFRVYIIMGRDKYGHDYSRQMHRHLF